MSGTTPSPQDSVYPPPGTYQSHVSSEVPELVVHTKPSSTAQDVAKFASYVLFLAANLLAITSFILGLSASLRFDLLVLGCYAGGTVLQVLGGGSRWFIALNAFNAALWFAMAAKAAG